jgi:hypothetical protein
LSDKDLVISGFEQRGDVLSNEEEFLSIKTIALENINK